MRVNLNGLHTVRAKLADGTIKTYIYAWRGGPLVEGKLGSPDFMVNYYLAVAKRSPEPNGKFQYLIDYFQSTTEFTTLRERTKADYIQQIKIIEKEFGNFPIKALKAEGTRGEFMEWRDRLAQKSLRQADYAFTVLARILSVAKNRGKIAVNPCEAGGRLYNGTRVDFIWTLDDEKAFLKLAPPHLHLPLLLGLWTGQRQGDLLAMAWTAYDGTHLKVRQSKSVRRGARRPVYVTIPVGAPLKAALDSSAKHKESPRVLLNSDGIPWTPGGFRASWRKACAKAGVVDVTFNDLRGTAVTRLALVGCSEPEIATITGHSLREVRSILDAHYLHRDPALAESAIRKLETRYAQVAGETKTGTESVK